MSPTFKTQLKQRLTQFIGEWIINFCRHGGFWFHKEKNNHSKVIGEKKLTECFTEQTCYVFISNKVAVLFLVELELDEAALRYAVNLHPYPRRVITEEERDVFCSFHADMLSKNWHRGVNHVRMFRSVFISLCCVFQSEQDGLREAGQGAGQEVCPCIERSSQWCHKREAGSLQSESTLTFAITQVTDELVSLFKHQMFSLIITSPPFRKSFLS